MRLFLLLLLLSILLQWVLPWWILAVVAFVLAFWLAHRGGEAFWAGFGAIALGWLALSLFFHVRNDGLLTSRVATLFTLPQPWLLLLITALLGGLVGGVAALTGYFFRRALA
ncbi:MAG: hypothetical protein JWQ14_3417 [Adhaeribacter sp.]|nr:hypothetical protein [Adhaeribacter sp.]